MNLRSVLHPTHLFAMAVAAAVAVFLGAVINGVMKESLPCGAPHPSAPRCVSADSHDMRQACMVELCATALNGRHLGGVTCHGDLGAPAVRILG